MVNKVLFTLYSTVSYFTDLFTVKALPSLAIELLKKLKDIKRIHKIDEGIAYVTFILKNSKQI